MIHKTKHLYKTEYLWHQTPKHSTSNSRRSRLVQGLHYLVCNGGGFSQILMELVISTISLHALPKWIKWSTWPVGPYQPEYMSHVLSGGRGDVPFKAFRYFTKPPHQRERFIFIPLWDLPQALPRPEQHPSPL